MATSILLAERAVRLARSLPTGSPSAVLAWNQARGLLAALPDPSDRARILGF